MYCAIYSSNLYGISLLRNSKFANVLDATTDIGICISVLSALPTPFGCGKSAVKILLSIPPSVAVHHDKNLPSSTWHIKILVVSYLPNKKRKILWLIAQ
jgi:hypothetical protein